jgi:hypothetical protein
MYDRQIYQEEKTMGGNQETTPSAAAIPAAPPIPTTPTQTAGATITPAAGSGSSSGQLPYLPQPTLAAALLAGALLIIFGTGAWFLFKKSLGPLGYTGGGAAAAVGILVVLALVLRYPTLIMDDTLAAGGEPSTMRIMSLAIVLTFCLVALRTGWNNGALPTVDGNWVWLVTAALGGKAVQKFAEVKDNSKTDHGAGT